MLETVSTGFRDAIQKFRGKATLSESLVDEASDLIRRSLLEADVEYSVVQTFLKNVRAKSLGQTVQLKAGTGMNSLRVSPQDHFTKICQEELEGLMGPVDVNLALPTTKIATVMLVGLQGSGKTTSAGKLALYLRDKKKRKPLLVAADIYRPAAVDQLQVLAKRLDVEFFHAAGANPVDICAQGLQEAGKRGCDVVVFDTAGRLTIDEALMQELKDIRTKTNPDNILLVCDAMMGQDAVRTARAFDEALTLSGVIMTKLDGDARGGAALSVKSVLGKPIKFLGMGESLERLEEFRPEGLASRILGMGDIVGLMEDFEKVAQEDEEEKAMKMLQGQFSFRDFYEQISMIQKMGPLKDIIAKMPMQNMLPKDLNVDDRELSKIKAMIDSMTEEERVKPSVMNDNRIRRIAGGSGRSQKEVSELVQRFKMMRQMMGSLGKNMGGLLGKIPGMGQLSQLNQMRKMMQGGAGGGMGGLGQMLGGMGNPFAGMGNAYQPKRSNDKDKTKKLRKLAKDARKKNRR